MPQPMTPAPDAQKGWDNTRDSALRLAQAMAGMVSPEPRSPGAAMVAALRSLVPGKGTFREEFNRYNEAAGPGDSVMGRYGGQLPGESLYDSFMRQANSPESERLSAMAGGMAAPIKYAKVPSARYFHGGPEPISAVDQLRLQSRDAGDWGAGFYGSKTVDLAEEYAKHVRFSPLKTREGFVSEFSMPDAMIAQIDAVKDGPRFALDLSPGEVADISAFHGAPVPPVLSSDTLRKISDWLRATGKADAMTVGGMEDVLVMNPSAPVFHGAKPVK